MGDALRDRLSDAGSIPARSTFYAESEHGKFGFFAFRPIYHAESERGKFGFFAFRPIYHPKSERSRFRFCSLNSNLCAKGCCLPDIFQGNSSPIYTFFSSSFILRTLLHIFLVFPEWEDDTGSGSHIPRTPHRQKLLLQGTDNDLSPSLPDCSVPDTRQTEKRPVY